tara:strand:+ start:125 stop:745 length:621 start_codon:yes stop_codon:yes gene_type:complete
MSQNIKETMLNMNFVIDPSYNAWTTAQEEQSPLICAENREKRIRDINKRIFNDDSEKPFNEWKIVRNADNSWKIKVDADYRTERIGHSQCFCSAEIAEVAIFVREGLRLVVGCVCLSHFTGMKERIQKENAIIKTCIKCGNGKHFKGSLCSKCKNKEEKITVKTKLLMLHSKFPKNVFYDNLMKFKTLSDKQKDCINANYEKHISN